MKKIMIILSLLFATTSAFASGSKARFSCSPEHGRQELPIILFFSNNGLSLQMRLFNNDINFSQIDISGTQVSANSSTRTYGELNQIHAMTRKVLAPVHGTVSVDAALAAANEETDLSNPVSGKIQITLNGVSAIYSCFELFD